jgi:hypothetical protein
MDMLWYYRGRGRVEVLLYYTTDNEDGNLVFHGDILSGVIALVSRRHVLKVHPLLSRASFTRVCHKKKGNVQRQAWTKGLSRLTMVYKEL